MGQLYIFTQCHLTSVDCRESGSNEININHRRDAVPHSFVHPLMETGLNYALTLQVEACSFFSTLRFRTADLQQIV